MSSDDLKKIFDESIGSTKCVGFEPGRCGSVDTP